MRIRPFRKRINRRNLNVVLLVGEVVDVGYLPKENGYNVRARLRLCPNVSNAEQFTYVEVFGRKSCSEAMTLICQVGNIVYVEGEFRSSLGERDVSKTYVLVTHIECLLRNRSVVAPSTSIIQMLDQLDPIGYVPDITKDYGKRIEKKKSHRTNTKKVE